MMDHLATNRAFTLIELLIVVAIIGILAAIAVPNFLNAQMRAKIAGAESDMRNIDTALEMYHMDNGKYPQWKDTSGVNKNPVNRRLIGLTTPVSYMSTVPQDPFVYGAPGARLDNTQHEAYITYDYVEAWSTINWGKEPMLNLSYRCSEWRINSYGPDYTNHTGVLRYNATNGLRSLGDLIRTGPRASYPCDDSLVGS